MLLLDSSEEYVSGETHFCDLALFQLLQKPVFYAQISVIFSVLKQTPLCSRQLLSGLLCLLSMLCFWCSFACRLASCFCLEGKLLQILITLFLPCLVFELYVMQSQSCPHC